MINFLAWLLAGVLIIVTISIHYEAMLLVSDHLVPWATRRFQGRRVIAIAVTALMLSHILEVWIFAAAYLFAAQPFGFGSVAGDFDGSFNSYLYFSAVNYTSLGDNMMHPRGALRDIAAAETLAGMLMIGWSASFTYLKMEQIWQGHRRG